MAVGSARARSTAQGVGDYGISGDLRRARETQAAAQLAQALVERDAALQREAALRAQLAVKAEAAATSTNKQRRGPYGPREAGQRMEAVRGQLEAAGTFQEICRITHRYRLTLDHMQKNHVPTEGCTYRIYRELERRRTGL
jgi:hypothetical protein